MIDELTILQRLLDDINYGIIIGLVCGFLLPMIKFHRKH